MAVKMAKAKVIGPIPSASHQGALWKVRLAVPRFPFYLDSQMSFATKAQADKFAERWRRRIVAVIVHNVAGTARKSFT